MTNYCTAAEARAQVKKLTYEEVGFSLEADFTTAITGILPDVDKLINNHCHRQFFTVEDATEMFDGKGQKYLFPTQTPIITLSKVEYRSSQTGSWTEQTLTDFYAYEEYIWYEDRFTLGHQNYRITYDYGYAAVPADIKRAAIQIAANIIMQWRMNSDPSLSPAQDFKVRAPAQDVITPNEERILRPYVKAIAACA